MNSIYMFKKTVCSIFIFCVAVLITSCSSGGGDSGGATTAPVTAATTTLGFDIKTFRFTWTDVSDATFYRLMENPDGASGFTQVSGDITQGTQTFDHTVALYLRTGASYFLQSCNSAGCTDGNTISITGTLASAVGYFKSSNTVSSGEFGIDVALSSDGNTLAVGARNEAGDTGAVYVFAKSAGSWVKQSDLTVSPSAAGDFFGTSVSLSADGNTLAVGAKESVGSGTGTVYIFKRNGVIWSQADSDKANVTGPDSFGAAVSLSDDGTTLAVGAPEEDNPNTGVGAIDNLNGAGLAGAAYIFTVDNNGNSLQEIYIKADNAEGGDLFGSSVSLSADGNTLVVGATGENSSVTGASAAVGAVNNAALAAGAAYVYVRNGSSWLLESYIKASNTGDGDNFGSSVSLSDNGNTLAVGATFEDSMATDIGGDDTNNGADGAGAAYVFSRSDSAWTQQAYIKASNTDAGDNFGKSVSLSADGNVLAVGATGEQSSATGVDGDEVTGALSNAGAAYLYIRDAGIWSKQAYLKASNTGQGDAFGTSIELSGDGNTLSVGAKDEDGSATGIGGNLTDNNATGAGAVYLY